MSDYRGWIQIVEMAVCDCGWSSDDGDPERAGEAHERETGHPFDAEHVSD